MSVRDEGEGRGQGAGSRGGQGGILHAAGPQVVNSTPGSGLVMNMYIFQYSITTVSTDSMPIFTRT